MISIKAINFYSTSFFFLFPGYMLLYLFAIQSLSLAVTNLVNSRHLSAGLTGVTSLCLSLASGVAVHHEEVGIWAAWLRYASPLWWMQHPLLQVKNEKFPLFLQLSIKKAFSNLTIWVSSLKVKLSDIHTNFCGLYLTMQFYKATNEKFICPDFTPKRSNKDPNLLDF